LKGKADVVEFLLLETKEKDNVNNLYGQIGSTALHVAAERGHYTVVSTLLRYGVDVFKSRSNNNHRNALSLAANKGYFHVVKALLIFNYSIDSLKRARDEVRGNHAAIEALITDHLNSGPVYYRAPTSSLKKNR
jgi:ankyrin repeat protein